MQSVFKFPFAMGEKITVQLGRTPILGVTLARLAVLVAWAHELEVLAAGNPDLRSFAQWTVIGYFSWNLLCIASVLFTPRWELVARPALLLVDFLVCATLVVLFRPLELPAILCCLLLLWASHERLGTSISCIAALGFILAFLFRNHYEPLAQSYALLSSSEYTDSASIFIGSLIALAVIGSHLYQGRLKGWSDQLQAAGGNLSQPPIEFLLTRVAGLFNARAVHFLWEDMNDDALHYCGLSEGVTSPQRIAEEHMRPLLHPPVRDRAFLFAAHSDDLFFRNSFGGLKFCRTPAYVDGLNTTFKIRRGASFAVSAGALRGRFIIDCHHGWSPNLLAQCDSASDSVDLFFERSFFLNAWRDRAFAEARLALSGDMHDSILQTLAAMRMRFSALLPKLGKVLPEMQAAELAHIQKLIINEQGRLRQLLNESKRVNGVSQNLAESLTACADMLSSQWDIDCHACVDHPEIDIDRTTAIEVEFLVREAVANAVQHADARQVTIAAAVNGDALLMAFRNDGMPGQRVNGHGTIDGIQSQSLTRRLKLLGGTAYFDNINDKTLLSISIPLRHTEKRV